MPKSKATIPLAKLMSLHPRTDEVSENYFPNNHQMSEEERKALVERHSKNYVTEEIKEV